MDQIAALVAQGRQLQRARQFAGALACFDAALALDGDHMEALGNRGGTLGALGRFDEALRDYDRALALQPDHPMLLYNRGNALLHLGRLNEALTNFDRALAIDPDAPQILLNRGSALRGLKQYKEAQASFDQAIALKPDYVKALCSRGGMLWTDLRQVEAALEDFERAFALEPETDNLRGDLLHLRMHVGAWRDFEKQKALVDEGVRAGRRSIGPFAYQAISEAPADLMACSVMLAQDRYPARPPLVTTSWRHSKIRVGYLCGEFREQATSFLTAGLYEQHDRAKFEIIALDSGWSDNSPMRKRLEAAFDKFVDIAGLSDAQAAAKIVAEEIDVLVNLNGYFGGNRMGVFAHRPAPIQVNYLGFPATLGAPYIDYIIADACVIPENDHRFYSEKVITLPGSYQANDSKRAIAEETPERAACGLPPQGLVFCNFNQSYKLAPAVFAAWMRILNQVPGSVLWLLQSNGQFAANIRRAAEAAGVAGTRIIFAPMIPADRHLARLRLADLFLDTAPYNAHTTASDALWAGVPLVTCLGKTFPGRVSASLLEAIGLPELVTQDLQAYEALAVGLATDPAALRRLREKLADNRLTMPLFDTRRFTRRLESAYAEMTAILQRGEFPKSFAVAP